MASYCQVYGVIHFTSPAGWLPVHGDQLRAQRSVTSVWKLYLFLPFTSFLGVLVLEWHEFRAMISAACHYVHCTVTKKLAVVWSSRPLETEILRSWSCYSWCWLQHWKLGIIWDQSFIVRCTWQEVKCTVCGNKKRRQYKKRQYVWNGTGVLNEIFLSEWARILTQTVQIL